MNRLISTVLGLTLLSGCASVPSSAWIGAGAGGAIGGVAGSAIGSPDAAIGGAAIGAVSGALIGGVIGYLVRPKGEVISTSVSKDKETWPKLSDPQVRKIRVDSKIEDGKYIEEHDVFVIEKEASWILN